MALVWAAGKLAAGYGVGAAGAAAAAADLEATRVGGGAKNDDLATPKAD
jgi:hypothetical protein